MDETPPPAEPPRRSALVAIIAPLVFVFSTLCVMVFTSDRANFPLPSPLIHQFGDVEGLELSALGEMYAEGADYSLLRTYRSLVWPGTWSEFHVDPANVDWVGHLAGVTAIVVYTLVGLAVLLSLGVRWTWPVQLAVGYAAGVGVCGWVFEQWATVFLLNRWTVLGTLLLLGAGWGLIARKRAKSVGVDQGEPDIGAAHAKSTIDLSFRVVVWGLLGVTVLLSFVHAVAFPPANWDGLILYLGYARKTHEAGGFPIKVCAQVGIGLGANYPHLFEVTQAAITVLFGKWTPLVGQWAVPWAALCATVCVYATAHRVFRRRDLALCAALIFRSYPYAISHWQLESNYPLAVLLTAAVLLAAYDWLVTGQRRFAVLMLCLTAAASHVNYVMPSLWGIALAALVMRWGIERRVRPEDSPHWAKRETGWKVVVAALLATLALGASWHVRNGAVTGNPVYAFFSEIFDGRNINPEVLASAEREWMANGDGIGRFASQVGEHSVWGNLRALPTFLFFEPVFRWKLAPLFEGFALPGILLLIGGLFAWRRWAVLESAERLLWWVLAVLLFFGLWFYHIVVADYYLYQILPMLVPATLFAVVPLTLAGWCGQALRVVLVFAVVMIAVPMSLMGFKIKRFDDQMNLHALGHAFPDTMEFYTRAFSPEEVLIWQTLERDWKGARLLTHDNRHLIYDPMVEIVHLDDCDVQAVYEISDPNERLEFWRSLGVDLYLRIPNEENHAINARAGMQGLIDRGDLRPLIHLGEHALYAFPWAQPRSE